LFTGSGYFTKTKIFGTVAEANAPNRAQLFASFGPITFLLALIMGGGFLWRGLATPQCNCPHLRCLGLCGYVHGLERCSFHVQRHAHYGHSRSCWNRCVLEVGRLERTCPLVEEIRHPNTGRPNIRRSQGRVEDPSILRRVPRDGHDFRTTGHLRIGLRYPRYLCNQESEIDERIYNIMPDILRFDGLGFSIFDSSTYDGRWYLGSFGSSFNDNGWNTAYDWLANQDTDINILNAQPLYHGGTTVSKP